MASWVLVKRQEQQLACTFCADEAENVVGHWSLPRREPQYPFFIRKKNSTTRIRYKVTKTLVADWVWAVVPPSSPSDSTAPHGLALADRHRGG
uniref:Uncharacterized protein n=1 Tax=Oryza meridionalis TaxID=40149 RepID=A0A0E0D3U2_9ORYZ